MSFWFSEHNPTLPQHDTSKEQHKRAQQLESAQCTYEWTDSQENLVGVPMADDVPRADIPTIPWFLDVLEQLAVIVKNQIEVAFDDDDDEAKQQAGQGVKKAQSTANMIGEAHDGVLGQHNQVIGAAMLTTLLPSLLNQEDSLSNLVGQLRKTERKAMEKIRSKQMEGNALHEYEALFQSIPLPTIAKTFEEDKTFARLRLAGPNPMLLKRIDVLPANFSVTDVQYQQAMGDQGQLAQALQDQRVFLLDYAELVTLVENPSASDGKPTQVFAPFVLLALTMDRQELLPVAIQCDQNPEAGPIIARPNKQSSVQDRWLWQMAKTAAQVADMNYHELFVHLARTHLVVEACAVATHRHLATVHPLNALLLPHFEGTLFINNAAAAALIAPKGPIDNTFGSTIESIQKVAGVDRLQFDFYANMLPADLQARGVDDTSVLPDYPYRDDALLIWDAIHTWVKHYVAVYYTCDQDVLGDTELAAWAAALIGEGQIKGFTSIESCDQLVDVVTMIIFTASAQHAAVNFPQKSLMTYAPAIAGGAWADVSPGNVADEKHWLKMLPPIAEASEQLTLLSLLGGVYYRKLGEYLNNSFPYGDALEDKRIVDDGGPLAAFQVRLSEITAIINQRNQERPEPYEFLLPDNIPPSINI